MKTYTVILALFALLVATVQAVSLGTNAERMARGLPPRAPRKLYREASRTERTSSVLLVLGSVSILGFVAVAVAIPSPLHFPSAAALE